MGTLSLKTLNKVLKIFFDFFSKYIQNLPEIWLKVGQMLKFREKVDHPKIHICKEG